MIALGILISIVVFLVILSLYIHVKNRRFWKLLESVYGERTLPIIGNAHQFGSVLKGTDFLLKSNSLSKQAGYCSYKFSMGSLCFVGLCEPETIESGKTLMSNYLSECVDMEANNETRPTQGARILEFEVNNLNTRDKISKVEIELWDCSGDHRFETCWPIFRNNIHGVIFVCSVNNASSASKEFELLYNYFIIQPELSPKHCVVFFNTLGLQNDSKGLRLSSTFSKVSQVPINISEAGNKFKSDFTNYISTLVNIVTEQ